MALFQSDLRDALKRLDSGRITPRAACDKAIDKEQFKDVAVE